jgi:hypothetical protein
MGFDKQGACPFAPEDDEGAKPSSVKTGEGALPPLPRRMTGRLNPSGVPLAFSLGAGLAGRGRGTQDGVATEVVGVGVPRMGPRLARGKLFFRFLSLISCAHRCRHLCGGVLYLAYYFHFVH